MVHWDGKIIQFLSGQTEDLPNHILGQFIVPSVIPDGIQWPNVKIFGISYFISHYVICRLHFDLLVITNCAITLLDDAE